MAETIRIRLTSFPSARDLEYLVRRFVSIDGVYDLPVPLALALMGLGYAAQCDSSEPLTDLSDGLWASDEDEEDD